jgi:hypothetical protein
MNLMKGAISGDERRHPSGGEDELGRDEVIRAHQSSSELIGAHQRTYLGVMPCTVWVTARASTGAANE